jgi:hypothetical protein
MRYVRGLQKLTCGVYNIETDFLAIWVQLYTLRSTHLGHPCNPDQHLEEIGAGSRKNYFLTIKAWSSALSIQL